MFFCTGNGGGVDLLPSRALGQRGQVVYAVHLREHWKAKGNCPHSGWVPTLCLTNPASEIAISCFHWNHWFEYYPLPFSLSFSLSHPLSLSSLSLSFCSSSPSTSSMPLTTTQKTMTSLPVWLTLAGSRDTPMLSMALSVTEEQQSCLRVFPLTPIQVLG